MNTPDTARTNNGRIERPETLGCPFCGVKPKTKLSKLGHCQLHGEPMQSFIVYCDNHKCLVRPQVAGGDATWKGRETDELTKALAIWNDRPAPRPQPVTEGLPETDKLVEALKSQQLADLAHGIADNIVREVDFENEDDEGFKANIGNVIHSRLAELTSALTPSPAPANDKHAAEVVA